MWKERVNDVLRKSIGYQLQKASASGPTPIPPPGPAAPRAARPPRAGRAGAGPAAAPTAVKDRPAKVRSTEDGSAKDRAAKDRSAKPEPRKMPMHFDEDAKRIINEVTPRTMTGRDKLFGLILASRYIAEQNVPGEVVECGVWRGGSMQAAALALIAAGDTSRELHLFDTYEGMPPPSDKDRNNFGQNASDLLATSNRTSNLWAVATLDDVQQGMADLAYPQDKIHFHKGKVEDTIPGDAPETIALLRLDTDWYESTRHELEHLYDRLSPGGILIIDDYGHWEGARLATQEFLAKRGGRLLLLPCGTGRIGVKPWV